MNPVLVHWLFEFLYYSSTLALQFIQDLYESSVSTLTICATFIETKSSDSCGHSITAASSISVIVKLLFRMDKYF